MIAVVTEIDESTYWVHLEYRVCRELAGLSDKKLRALWCDGLIPEQFHLEDDHASVTGGAWIGQGSGQERWTFVLVIGGNIHRREDIKWPALLPAPDVTGWLSIDTARNTLTIDPSSAYPDNPSPRT